MKPGMRGCAANHHLPCLVQAVNFGRRPMDGMHILGSKMQVVLIQDGAPVGYRSVALKKLLNSMVHGTYNII